MELEQYPWTFNRYIGSNCSNNNHSNSNDSVFLMFIHSVGQYRALITQGRLCEKIRWFVPHPLILLAFCLRILDFEFLTFDF